MGIDTRILLPIVELKLSSRYDFRVIVCLANISANGYFCENEQK
jgi:hypothetical protein